MSKNQMPENQMTIKTHDYKNRWPRKQMTENQMTIKIHDWKTDDWKTDDWNKGDQENTWLNNR